MLFGDKPDCGLSESKPINLSVKPWRFLRYNYIGGRLGGKRGGKLAGWGLGRISDSMDSEPLAQWRTRVACIPKFLLSTMTPSLTPFLANIYAVPALNTTRPSPRK